MPPLILVRHSQSQMDPEQPARYWGLTAEGRLRCQVLAEALRPYQPQRIVSSREPKALETGQLLAQALRLPWTMAAGLHEHEREHLPFLDTQTFLARVADLFVRPTELVLGEETARQAEGRFTQAVTAALARYPDECLAITTHGTVLSLFVARLCGLDGYKLWQWLEMPAFVVLTYPQGELLARWKWSPELQSRNNLG